MYWQSEVESNQRDIYGFFEVAAIVAFIFSLLTYRPTLMIVAGILMVFIFANKIYDKRIGKHLILQNPKMSVQLFVEKENFLTFTFENHSLLPINNARLSFVIKDIIEIQGYEKQDIGENKLKIFVPITITGKGETKVKIPFIGKGRGITRIQSLELEFPHFLNFQKVVLRFDSYYQTEILIYPKPLSVTGIKESYLNTLGKQYTNFSTFEDVLNPIGTRDYVRSDPFHRIHWKATVRKQSLQTKVLEKTRDNTWIFIINLSTISRAGNKFFAKNMENLISYATFMCHLATKQGFPFEIHINTRKGNRYFAGEGRDHLKGALQFLSTVSEQNMLFFFNKYLSLIDTQLSQPRSIVIFGELPEDCNDYLSKWTRKGMPLYHVTENKREAVMELIKKAGYRYA